MNSLRQISRLPNRAFTLIELLIVVAIIAILAAIAVPNFLEAQTRAKASRAKNDLRTLATGLEAYAVDHNAYPLCNNEMLDGWRPVSDSGNDNRYLERLSTPIAYLSSPLYRDPFDPFARYHDFSQASPQGTFSDQRSDGDYIRIRDYKYGAVRTDAGLSGSFANTPPEKASAFILYSSGPDKGYSGMSSVMTLLEADANVVSGLFYDPTNGTVSYGDIWRIGGSTYPGQGGSGGEFFAQAGRNSSK